MRFASAFLTILLGLSLNAGATSPKVTGDPKRAAEVQQLFDAWIAAQNSHDLEKVMAVFDKDVVLSAQGQPDRNYAELEAGFKWEFSWPGKGIWRATLEEIHADRNLTVAISRWEFSMDTPEGPMTPVATILSVDTLRRTKGGWKVVRTINYPIAEKAIP